MVLISRLIATFFTPLNTLNSLPKRVQAFVFLITSATMTLLV